MYELIKVTDRTYYIECPAKMGMYIDDDDKVILIDSGGDKDSGRKVIRHLEEMGRDLKAIINTHSNADHIGGNDILIKRTGAVAYTTKQEGAINEWPQFEPTILYGGYPSKAIRNKFLMAKPTPYTDIEEMDMPAGMEIFHLPGHYIDMIGVKTPDDVYFMADCVSSQNILDKYHVGFIYDVAAYLNTLDEIENWEGFKFVPAHAPACDDMKELCRINRDKVHEVIDTIKQLSAEGITIDELIKRTFDHYNLSMDFNQHVLVGSTLRSYLSYMADEGIMTYEFQDNYLKWKAV